MRYFGRIILLAAMIMGLHCPAFSRDLSAFSRKQILVAADLHGDLSAKWSLAWLGLEVGDLNEAWSWMVNVEPTTSEQAYLKAWTALRLGLATDSLSVIRKSQCDSESCLRLGVAADWDVGAFDDASKRADQLFAKEESPSSFYLALLASLTARNFSRFDALSLGQPWRDAIQFEPWRQQILELHKLRQNY